MKVNDVWQHRRQCFIAKKPCIFGCGSILKGKAEHQRHAMQDCPKVDTICQSCEGHLRKEDQDRHDCVPNLIFRVKEESSRKAIGAARTQLSEEIKTQNNQR